MFPRYFVSVCLCQRKRVGKYVCVWGCESCSRVTLCLCVCVEEREWVSVRVREGVCRVPTLL